MNVLIKQLEKEIEQNKKQAQLFISGIVKSKKVKEEDVTDICEYTEDNDTDENNAEEDEKDILGLGDFQEKLQIDIALKKTAILDDEVIIKKKSKKPKNNKNVKTLHL